MKHRREIEEEILTFAKRMTPGGGSHSVYQALFKRLNDEQFKAFWNGICDSNFIPIFVNNFDNKEMIDFDEICRFAKEEGIPLEQQLVITDPDSGLQYTTPEKAVVGYAETRKQRQLQAKKFGASKHDHETEDLTGQPTGDSKAGGISSPEIRVLLGLGLKTTAKELFDVRGGDTKAYNAYKSDILTSGETTTQSSLKRGGGVKSLQTAHFLLRGRMLDNNLNSGN